MDFLEKMAPKIDGVKVKFTDGERVLCFHGPLIYEAKCMKAELKESKMKYLIHYNGWNKSWDEWVPESRVLKFNDSNLQKQKDLLKQHGKDKLRRGKHVKQKLEKEGEKVKKVAANADHQTAGGEPKKKKTRVDPTVETEESFLSKVEIKVEIPDELKPILVDDWDLITRQKQLYHLPARKTVVDILNDYMKYYDSKEDETERPSTIIEMVDGIKEYFNVMLGSQLLYKFERPQYGEILEKNADLTMSQLYGAPHFLRFFVKMGSMLAYTNLTEKSMRVLISHIHKLLGYIKDNAQTLFSTDEYEVAPADYHRKAMT